MSLTTMAMAPTFPEGDILDEFSEWEERTIYDSAEMLYTAYHRGCRRQMIRCMAQYMYHEGKTYEDSRKLFNYPLIQYQNLRDEVEAYLKIYSAMQEKENRESANKKSSPK